MEVAIVTVGDELLAGDTVNTNAAWLGRELAGRGVAVQRVVVLPDRVEDIARTVREFRETYDAVVVTGGLGPTHDDLTMEGVAAAFDRDLVADESVLDRLADEGGYARGDLAVGTAEIPEGATPLHNEVGVAPGCVLDGVYVLPGVPSEMKAMFEAVAGDFAGEPVFSETVRAGEPESALLDRIAAVRRRFDVAVGSYPGSNVRLKVSGSDAATVTDAAAWLRENVVDPDEAEQEEADTDEEEGQAEQEERHADEEDE